MKRLLSRVVWGVLCSMSIGLPMYSTVDLVIGLSIRGGVGGSRAVAVAGGTHGGGRCTQENL